MARYKSILLVDDNDADNFLHREVIAEAGFAERVDEVLDGEDAIRFIQEAEADDDGYFPPACIFLDIRMPRMDGFEFLEAFETLPAERRTSTVIIMLTSSMNERDQERAARFESVGGYLQKPLTVEQLDGIEIPRN